jgi:hypothetical protein
VGSISCSIIGSFSKLGRISIKVATAHGLVERGSNGPIHLMNATRTHQGAAPRLNLEHCHVQLLEMLGSQRCEAMTPDARYQVDPDGSPIALIRAPLNEGPRHVLKPIFQPRFNGPRFRQIAELPSIASLLQRLHSLDNLRLGCRGHMTAIRASLIREINCDASMPTPVAAFVDR